MALKEIVNKAFDDAQPSSEKRKNPWPFARQLFQKCAEDLVPLEAL
jgi:hypothetical protein